MFTKFREKFKLSSSTKMFLVLLPCIVYVFFMSYKPLLGLGYAFVEYKPRVSMWDSKFVGLKYYKMLVQNPLQGREFLYAVRNTLVMSFIGMATSFLPIVVTLFLNEVALKWYKKLVQTIITLPHFLSWVIIYACFYNILAPREGLLSILLNNWGIIEGSFDLLVDAKYGYLLRFLLGNWAGLGWGTIVYFAALSSVDTELYEAAEVDGAGRLQKMWYISVPSLMPTYVTLLILSIGTILNSGTEFPLVFGNSYNRETLTTIDYYVYQFGLQGGNMSLGTAVGLAKSLVGLFLMFFANYLSKKIRGAAIF